MINSYLLGPRYFDAAQKPTEREPRSMNPEETQTPEEIAAELDGMETGTNEPIVQPEPMWDDSDSGATPETVEPEIERVPAGEEFPEESPKAKPAAKSAPAPKSKPAPAPKPAPKPKATKATPSPKITGAPGAADADAMALLTVFESNLDIAASLTGTMAALSFDALVSAYKSADTMESASWVIKAGTAYQLREQVKAKLAERGDSQDAASYKARIDTEMAKIATSALGAEPKTLRDYSRVYGNFFVSDLGLDDAGQKITGDAVIDAVRAGVGWSLFVEADRAPSRGKCLMLFKDIVLSGQKLSVRDARMKVDQMRTEAGFGDTEAENKGAEEGKTSAPTRRSLSAIERPQGPMPGVTGAFINALVRASNDIARESDPDAEIFVYIDDMGDVCTGKTMPEITDPSDGLETEGIGVRAFVSITKKTFSLDAMFAKGL